MCKNKNRALNSVVRCDLADPAARLLIGEFVIVFDKVHRPFCSVLVDVDS